jgi:fucose 4-O-acetylase-like acetyltransferase
MSTPSNLPTCLPYLNKTGGLMYKLMSILFFGRVQVFMNQACLGVMMKKALAQNPNLLRTLIGLSLTLIFLLSYAVYGATVSPSYYIYQTESTDTEYNDFDLDKQVINNETYWTSVVEIDAQNLTWVNMSI